ncbi:hypothetical protein DRE_00018 [Drechslerella stenobrocha 248]|uniref:SART-1 protein n=1 Tax=Drechslerella stenobrocha 248 TaxID=1043628 RepID=W7I8S4_9PEZI|nr:hypothetical protein DRE_00018 [Drechslerella stenobrocha 248]
MASGDVEEISIEETNRIRASLGLKPLRVDPAPATAARERPPKADDSGDGISIEETNRLRAALGLKPLKTDTSGPPDADDNSFDAQERRAADNWKKHQEEEDRKKRRQELKEKIRKGQDKAQREKKLEGKGLADDSDDEGALAWIKQSKKRQRKAAAQIEKDLQDREEEEARLRKEYDARDLAGLRVGHDIDEFGDAIDGAVLTLKDAEVIGEDNEEDELENAGLVERQKLKERLDAKKRKPDYNPYGDDDDDAEGESSVLSKYDDDIDPKKKRKFFVLDEGGSTASVPSKDVKRQQQISEKLKKIPVSLDILKPAEQQSDYIDPTTIKVKQPRKKKVRTQRRVAEPDEDIFLPETVSIGGNAAAAANSDSGGGGAMNVDSAAAESKPRRVFQESFVDDDDLSAALALQRRAALKKQKALKPEELAKKLKEEGIDQAMAVDDDTEAPGLIIDETTEFVGSLQAPTIPIRRPREAPREAPREVPKPPAEDEPKSEPSSPDADGDVAMGSTNADREMSPEAEVKVEPEAAGITSTGLEEETTIGVGVGSMLSMLRQRQLVDSAMDPEAHDKMMEKETFLARQRVAQLEAERKAKAARERDRNSGKFDKMSAREKEEYARYENKQRDTQEARDAAARFKDYKPDVKLEYKDEFGRSMNQKEAFKYLSHQFHGKWSGKKKTEKKLKKIDDEKKRMAASSLNPEGLAGTIADTAKKSRTAGVRLM